MRARSASRVRTVHDSDRAAHCRRACPSGGPRPPDADCAYGIGASLQRVVAGQTQLSNHAHPQQRLKRLNDGHSLANAFPSGHGRMGTTHDVPMSKESVEGAEHGRHPVGVLVAVPHARNNSSSKAMSPSDERLKRLAVSHGTTCPCRTVTSGCDAPVEAGSASPPIVVAFDRRNEGLSCWGHTAGAACRMRRKGDRAGCASPRLAVIRFWSCQD